MRTKLFIALAFFVTMSVSVYSQYLVVDTNFTTDPGLGAPASCIWTGGTGYGSTASIATGFTIADDFVVPSGQSWRIDSVNVYGYQTGSTTTSTFNAGNIKIWMGRPDSVGSVVVFSDTTGTGFLSTSWTGVYRVSSTTLTNTQRPIMRIALRCGSTVLAPGRYWIEYWLNGTLASGPFTPAKVLPGRLNPPNQNGKQRTVATNVWAEALDVQPIGFNMIVMGSNLTATGNNQNELPISYDLKQNYPNPFNPSTTIGFDLPNSAFTKLTVYNALGQTVKTLIETDLSAGSHNVQFNADGLPSGVYMYKLESGEFVATKKLTLVK